MAPGRFLLEAALDWPRLAFLIAITFFIAQGFVIAYVATKRNWSPDTIRRIALKVFWNIVLQVVAFCVLNIWLRPELSILL